MLRYLYFSLLNTKGSASFSFASNSESDSRRLKVKLAAGSVCRKNHNGIFSRASFRHVLRLHIMCKYSTSSSWGSACLGLAWLAVLCNVTVKSSWMLKTSSYEQKTLSILEWWRENSPLVETRTSWITFPDLKRFVIFATASSALVPGATVMTEVAKWPTLPTVPCWCMSAWSRPITALAAPPNENTEEDNGTQKLLYSIEIRNLIYLQCCLCYTPSLFQRVVHHLFEVDEEFCRQLDNRRVSGSRTENRSPVSLAWNLPLSTDGWSLPHRTGELWKVCYRTSQVGPCKHCESVVWSDQKKTQNRIRSNIKFKVYYANKDKTMQRIMLGKAVIVMLEGDIWYLWFRHNLIVKMWNIMTDY